MRGNEEAKERFFGRHLGCFGYLKIIAETRETEEPGRIVAESLWFDTLREDESFASDGLWGKVLGCAVHGVYAEWC